MESLYEYIHRRHSCWETMWKTNEPLATLLKRVTQSSYILIFNWESPSPFLSKDHMGVLTVLFTCPTNLVNSSMPCCYSRRCALAVPCLPVACPEQCHITPSMTATFALFFLTLFQQNLQIWSNWKRSIGSKGGQRSQSFLR